MNTWHDLCHVGLSVPQLNTNSPRHSSIYDINERQTHSIAHAQHMQPHNTSHPIHTAHSMNKKYPTNNTPRRHPIQIKHHIKHPKQSTLQARPLNNSRRPTRKQHDSSRFRRCLFIGGVSAPAVAQPMRYVRRKIGNDFTIFSISATLHVGTHARLIKT